MGTFCSACICELVVSQHILKLALLKMYPALSNTAYLAMSLPHTPLPHSYQWTQTDQLKYAYTSDWMHMHSRQTQNSQNSGMHTQNNHLYLRRPFVSIFTALFKYQVCRTRTNTHTHTKRSTAYIPVSPCSPKCLINIPLGVKALEQETIWKV